MPMTVATILMAPLRDGAASAWSLMGRSVAPLARDSTSPGALAGGGRDLVEITAEKLHAAPRLAPVVVLVDRVVAVLGQRQAQESDRRVQCLAHGQDRADRPAFA